MYFNDFKAFLNIESVLALPLTNGYYKRFYIPLNIPTRLFFKLNAVVELVNSDEKDILKESEIVSLITEILRLDDSHINEEWVRKYLYLETMLSAITKIATELSEILKDDVFKIPQFKINPKTDEKDKTKTEIVRLNNALSDKMPQTMIHIIAILTAKTANSYQDIMQMPILVFRDLVRDIIIDENKTNDEWHLRYLQSYEAKITDKISKEQKENKEKLNARKPKGANLSALKQLLG